MFAKFKQLLAVAAFGILSVNAHALPAQGLEEIPYDYNEDLGILDSFSQNLFQGSAALNTTGTFSALFTFEIWDSSYVSISVDDTTLPETNIFSELDLSFFVAGEQPVEFVFYETPASYGALLNPGFYSINVFGSVVTSGDYNGIYGAVGVVPAIPEMSTYAMLFVGMGLIGFVTRRRKQ